MKSINSAEDHAAALARVEHLVGMEPVADSPEGRELDALAAVLDTWENALDVIREFVPPDIEHCCDECGGDAARCRKVNPNCIYPMARALLTHNVEWRGERSESRSHAGLDDATEG